MTHVITHLTQSIKNDLMFAFFREIIILLSRKMKVYKNKRFEMMQTP